MTKPIEFIWNWGNSQGVVDRRVRFGMEAINDSSGTVTDPWDQKATIDPVDRLEFNIPNIDVQWWFHRLLKDFAISKDFLSEDHISRLDPQQLCSSIFMAFQWRDRMTTIKIYLMPFAEAMESSRFNWLSFLSPELEPFMIAFGDISSKQSRMKMYARCPDIKLASVMKTMSIFEDRSKVANGLEELRKLWVLIFSRGDESQASHLPTKRIFENSLLL
ncbi:hypothetical protein EAF04_006138 [Stromatinia cepivora]|nr:hypothetical protein EAF04_006138 [Stromatinia cepivora]